jgi:hypothetical protein
MAEFDTWVAYGGGLRLVLILVMVVIAIGLVLAGWRLEAAWRRPPAVRRRPLIALLIAWIVSIAAFLVCVTFYAEQVVREFPGRTAPTSPTLAVTLSAVVITFLLVLATRVPQDRVALASAVIAALAAPMVFELPFDLVVMARTYPGIPPDPTFYRVLFFAPLILVELTTLALLMCSPEVSVTNWTCYALAAMFTTFAVWAYLGFSYPASPSLIAANVVSKLLAFVATITLFFPVTARPHPRVSQPS